VTIHELIKQLQDKQEWEWRESVTLVNSFFTNLGNEWSMSQIAKKLGKSRSWMCETIMLAKALKIHPRLTEDKSYSRNTALAYIRKHKKLTQLVEGK
jgi:hypothetical protein